MTRGHGRIIARKLKKREADQIFMDKVISDDYNMGTTKDNEQ